MDISKPIPESFKIRALSYAVLALASASDAILLAFLPRFVADYLRTAEDKLEQNNAAMFILAFWLASSSARGIFVLR